MGSSSSAKEWPLVDDVADPWRRPWGTPGEPREDHEVRPPRLAAFVPSEDMMLRIATDHEPAMGNDAVYELLGPYALTASPALCLRAVGLMVGVQPSPEEVSAFTRWARDEPHPPVDVRQAARAVVRAPLVVWEREGDHLRDLVGLGEGWVPEEPVRIEDVYTIAPGRGLAARVFRTAEGWHAWGALELPLPDPGLLADAVLEARREAHDKMFERALADRGHVVVRRCLEALWART